MNRKRMIGVLKRTLERLDYHRATHYASIAAIPGQLDKDAKVREELSVAIKALEKGNGE